MAVLNAAPELGLSTLTLIRHAQIDFGVTIDPNLEAVRCYPETKLSRAHFHLYRIHYPAAGRQPADTGLLLYIKLSVTENETELLKRCRIDHSEFPHQSTLDQFLMKNNSRLTES